MIFSIRRVSLCKCISLPICLIHCLLWSVFVVFSLSSTASVTNCLRGIPCSAALDFDDKRDCPVFREWFSLLPIFPYYGNHSSQLRQTKTPALRLGFSARAPGLKVLSSPWRLEGLLVECLRRR